MRVAICISGQIRTGAIIAPFVREFIQDFNGEVDWFIQLWDWSQQKPAYNGGETFPRREITHAEVAAMREVFRPRDMVVVDHAAALAEADLEPHGTALSQWLGIGLCDALRLRWSRRSGIWHDAVLRIRPDVVYPIANTLDGWAWACRNGPSNVLWSAVCDDRRVDDVVWAGSHETMATAADHWRVFIGRRGWQDYERGLHDYLRDNGIRPLEVMLPHHCRRYAPVRETLQHLDVRDGFEAILAEDLRLYELRPPADGLGTTVAEPNVST